METPHSSTAVHLFFSGNVQGVGFRFIAQMFARELAINGTVKNLPDGRVEMVVQGTKTEIEQLINRLKEHFLLSDDACQISSKYFKGDYQDFHIVY